MAEKTRRGTCDGCGKVRKLTYRANRTREVMYHPDGRKKLLSPAEHAEAHKRLIHYYGLCSECFPKVETHADIVALRRARGPKPRAPRFAYPVIGGPLDGESATTADFGREGMYEHLAREYREFNAASGRSSKRIGASPSMVFLHTSLLRPLIAPRDR